MIFRTDEHNNPTAFTTDLAKEAGLSEGTDYRQGQPFTVSGHIFFTAQLLGNPIDLTIRLIDKLGFYTNIGGFMRWSYIAIPYKLWMALDRNAKIYAIGFMYGREGGTQLKHLFAATPTPINLTLDDTMHLEGEPR